MTITRRVANLSFNATGIRTNVFCIFIFRKTKSNQATKTVSTLSKQCPLYTKLVMFGTPLTHNVLQPI